MSTNVSSVIEKYTNTYPVQTTLIARDLGLKVYTSEMQTNVSGMIKKDEHQGGVSGYAIYVNDRHVSTRKRFTIAHEIGHFVLHKDFIGDGIVEDALLRAHGLTNAIERQANAFAADLLMPWKQLEQAQLDGYSSVEDLAREFEVSNDAMSYRLLGCSYEQAVALGKA